MHARPLRKRSDWRARRPRGWRIAGMRSHAEITHARIEYVLAVGRGETPGVSVTRRWPR
jgi:hypothetical protein